MKDNFTPAAVKARTPSGVLKLYCTPLSPTYSDSMIFKTAAKQVEWHTSQYNATASALTFNNMRPFRAGEEIIVNGDYEKIQKNNYFSYSGDSVIWYGFINAVTYVSENACKITYSIDVIQSFMFDAIIDSNGKSKIPECFVERETVASDKYFEHIVEEGIGTQTQVVKNKINLFSNFNTRTATDGKTTHTYLILSKNEMFLNVPAGDLHPLCYMFGAYGYNYNALFYSVCASSMLESMLPYLFSDKNFDANSIIGIYPIPDHFTTGDEGAVNMNLASATSAKHLTITIPTVTEYTPKNNKIYTQEFCKVKIQNTQSGETELATNKMLHGTTSLSDTLYVYLNASNVGGFIISNRQISEWAQSTTTLSDTNVLIFSNTLPSINLISDSYAEWTRNRSTVLSSTLASSALTTGIAIAGAALSPDIKTISNAVGSTSALVGGVAGAITERKNALLSADKLVSSSSTITDIYNCSAPIIMFTQPSVDEIKKIDSYFNAYGYKINEIKAPTLFNRKKWDFIKTTNCQTIGTCSHLYLDKINQIFNTGIRLHHDSFNTVVDCTITNATA